MGTRYSNFECVTCGDPLRLPAETKTVDAVCHDCYCDALARAPKQHEGNKKGERMSDADPSRERGEDRSSTPFIELAAMAYHRSEQDATGRLYEALGCGVGEDWHLASSRIRRNRDPMKLWMWALKRWGPPMWADTEYRIRKQWRDCKSANNQH